MNADNLMNSLEFIDDSLLETAADSMRKRKRPLPWKSLTALAACLALVAGLFAYNLSPVPVYPNALFSAKQLGAMLPSYKGAATNNYETEAFPKASMLNVPSLPWTTSLNVYRFNGAEPTAAEVEELMARVYPKLEKLYGKDIPIGQVEQTKTGYAHSNNYDYISETRFGDWWARGYNSRNSLSVSWGNIAGAPLVLNGITLKAHYSQTDEQIINDLSPAISHLEKTFGLTLSEYKISKSYSTSNGYLNYMQVWLYDEDSVLDRTLAKYADKPPIYCSGFDLSGILALLHRSFRNHILQNDPLRGLYAKSPRNLCPVQNDHPAGSANAAGQRLCFRSPRLQAVYEGAGQRGLHLLRQNHFEICLRRL